MRCQSKRIFGCFSCSKEISVTAQTLFVVNEPRLRETAARLFAEADWIAREPVMPGNDPYKAALGEIIAEKHRKMGLKLKLSDR